MTKKPVAVQLWTLRDEIAEDLPGTLAKVSDIGYDGVELWFRTYPPVAELKQMLKDCDLVPISAHVPYLDLRDHLEDVAAYHKELGNTNLTIPIIPGELRQTPEDWKRRVSEIEVIAHRCKELGCQLGYHNHTVEFESQVDGVDAHDYIFANVAPDLLKVQLDTYFIAAVDKDPVAYIQRYSGRMPLLHLKEKSKTPERNQNAEIGSGVIDWDAVFSAAEDAGVAWYIVEQNCEVYPAIQSVRMSYDYLVSKGVV